MRTKHIVMLTIFSLIITSFVTEKDKNNIFTFSTDAKTSNWYILNDGVMGGVSSSSLKVDSDGFGCFEGNVSTANNGGFASLRYVSLVRVGKRKTIKLKIKGDGKDYQFRVKKNSSDYESYITTFSTSGNWETIDIELEDLYPSFRGRKLQQPNFDATKFDELSILIANKKNESFKLLIQSIEIN